MPPRLPRARRDPRSLTVGALITVLVALGQISTALYLPSMPALVVDLATDAASVNLTMTVFLAGFAVSQVVYGPLSDRFGRRGVLLGALALFLAASVACALAWRIEALIAARFLQAVGACAGQVIGRAVVRDVYDRTEAAKVFAYIGIAFAVSPAVTPTIGGYLELWWGWRAGFVALSAVAAAVLYATWRLLAETNVHPDPEALDPLYLGRNAAILLRSADYAGYTASAALVFAGLMAYTVVAPFLFIDALGLSPERFGMLAAFNVIGFVVGTVTAGTFTRRFGIERMVLAGALLTLAAGVLMAAAAALGMLSVPAIIVPMIVFLCGMGLVMPNAMAGALAPFPRQAGTASALLGFVQMGTAALASLVVGVLPRDDQLGLGLVITATSGAALGLFLALIWNRRSARPEDRGGPEAGAPG